MRIIDNILHTEEVKEIQPTIGQKAHAIEETEEAPAQVTNTYLNIRLELICVCCIAIAVIVGSALYIVRHR